MPIDWIAILAGTAVSNLLGPRLKEAYDAVRERVKDALVDGPLEGPLRRVYRDACAGDLGVLALRLQPPDELGDVRAAHQGRGHETPQTTGKIYPAAKTRKEILPSACRPVVER